MEVENDVKENEGYTNIPEQEKKENYYLFMKYLKDTEDSKKIANLTSEELGKSELTVRGAGKLALLCYTLGMEELGKCYTKEGEITASTSMSRYTKGPNFLNLIFTQIRKSISGIDNSQAEPAKSKWFKRNVGD